MTTLNLHTPSADKPLRLLFICLGNICRSPAAQGVMQHLVDRAQLADRFLIDSAGIGSWHVGDLPDQRMREHGKARGYDFDHHARQFDADSDFRRFDLIITMDDENYRRITDMAHTDEARRRVVPMRRFLEEGSGATSVPDPYYGDARDFDLALDLIEEGCSRLLRDITDGDKTLADRPRTHHS